MMWEEFEKIAGYHVSYDDYKNYIEPMYMALNIDKTEFVKMINRKRFALRPSLAIQRDMKKCAESLKNTCTHYTDYETIDKLESLVKEYIKNVYGQYEIYLGFLYDYILIQSCHYPVSVEIYEHSTGKTLKKISFFN